MAQRLLCVVLLRVFSVGQPEFDHSAQRGASLAVVPDAPSEPSVKLGRPPKVSSMFSESENRNGIGCA